MSIAETAPSQSLSVWLRRAYGVRDAPTRVTMGSIALYLGLLVGGAVLAYLRLPARSRGLLWSEDGAVFLEQALVSPFHEALVRPYAGYLHFLPRTYAEILSWVPVDILPFVNSVALAVLVSLLGLAVYYLSAAHLRSQAARILLLLLVVAAPTAGMEISLSSANMQWYLLGGALFAVCARREGWTAATVAVVVLFAAFTSSVLALLFLPLVILRAVLFRRPTDYTLLAVGVVGSAVQLLGVIGSERSRNEAPFGIFDAFATFAVNVVQTAWMGPALTADMLRWAPTITIVVGFVLTALTIVLAWMMRRRAPLAIVAGAFAVGYYVVVAYLTAVPAYGLLGLIDIGSGTRYLVFPVFAVGIVIAATVDQELSSPRRAATGVAVGILVLQAVALVTSYRAFDVRAIQMRDDLPWSISVERAREECAAGAEFVYLRGGEEWPLDWDTMQVPCTYIGGR